MAMETLSVKQANKIADEFAGAVSIIIGEISDKNHEFYMAVKKIWQDQNACDFQEQHSQNIYVMRDTLKQNFRVFMQTLEEITNLYVQVGGMGEKFSPSYNENFVFNYGSVSRNDMLFDQFYPYFTDGFPPGLGGYSGDEFGFKNPQTGGQEVIDVFNQLVSSIENKVTEVTDRINNIDAFGNTTIQLNLAQSSGLIVSEVSKALSQSSKSIQELLEKTSAAYIKAGQMATDTAKLSVNSDSGPNIQPF